MRFTAAQHTKSQISFLIFALFTFPVCSLKDRPDQALQVIRLRRAVFRGAGQKCRAPIVCVRPPVCLCALFSQATTIPTLDFSYEIISITI